MSSGARLGMLVLVFAGCAEELELPPSIALSEYIDYHTDVDASVVCMDDALAREDRFIERTAGLLGVEPPAMTIDYVWDPSRDGSEPWACEAASEGCYKTTDRGDFSVVVSRFMSHHHEMVHAVSVSALGGTHWILEEGLAEYLGSLRPSFAREEFPALFKAMIAGGTKDLAEYRLAMHFVGSIFARHGAAKFRSLRAKMPKDAGVERFAEVFAAEYGRSLDEALVEMSAEDVYGNDVWGGCGDGEAPTLAWTDEGTLEDTVESECGDPWFFGAGFVAGRPGFYGRYTVEVAVEGMYELTVGAVPGGARPSIGVLTACSYELGGAGVLSAVGQTGEGALRPGRYSLAIGFPAGPEARGEASVRLVNVGPLP